VATVKVDSPSSEAAMNVASYTGKTVEASSAQKKPPSSIVTFEWAWTPSPQGGAVTEGNRIWLDVPLLPGPSTYHAAFSWDSEKGLFDGYLNGFPIRIPGGVSAPWNIIEQDCEFITAEGVRNFSIKGEFWTEEQVKAKVNKRKIIDLAPLIGYGGKAPLGNISGLKGKLLYSPDFSKPRDLEGWLLDGPGIIETTDKGWLIMESAEANAPGAGTGHIVYWAPEVFPSDFIAEWDFQAISEHGLCITFFAAKGRNGEHLSDPKLKKRTGVFPQYIMGDINTYHVSYYANTPGTPGRITSNLRKNYGFYLVSNGPPGVPARSLDIHKVVLIKDGSRIRLAVDGGIIIDWTDDGKTYGEALGSGQIGFRQMKWMKAQYNNFKVWELKK
jgi:hypothetical protein